MVSKYVAAACRDALAVQRSKKSLSDPKDVRSEAIVKALGADYPQPLRSYLSTVKPDAFLADMEDVVAMLGGQTSVIQALPDLQAKQNGFVDAIVQSLSESLVGWLQGGANGSSALAAYCNDISDAGALYQDILIREAQELYLQATGVDSPRIQVAAPMDEPMDTQDLPGVPSVKVNRELLGGVRQFYNGTMIDDSWRARLTRALRIVS